MQTIFAKGYLARVFRDAGDHKNSLKRINIAISQYEEQIEKAKDTEYLKQRPEYISMYATKGLLQMDTMLISKLEGNTTDDQHGLTEARNTLIKALTLQDIHSYKSLLQQVGIECTLGRVYCLLKENNTAMNLFEKAYNKCN